MCVNNVNVKDLQITHDPIEPKTTLKGSLLVKDKDHVDYYREAVQGLVGGPTFKSNDNGGFVITIVAQEYGQLAKMLDNVCHALNTAPQTAEIVQAKKPRQTPKELPLRRGPVIVGKR